MRAAGRRVRLTPDSARHMGLFVVGRLAVGTAKPMEATKQCRREHRPRPTHNCRSHPAPPPSVRPVTGQGQQANGGDQAMSPRAPAPANAQLPFPPGATAECSSDLPDDTVAATAHRESPDNGGGHMPARTPAYRVPRRRGGHNLPDDTVAATAHRESPDNGGGHMPARTPAYRVPHWRKEAQLKRKRRPRPAQRRGSLVSR